VELIEYGTHAALLDDDRGILVLPDPGGDVADPLPSGALLPDVEGLALGTASLHEADWVRALRDLAERGFAPVRADVHEPAVLGALLVGELSDGREVIALERV
jgi:hypothetical protein